MFSMPMPALPSILARNNNCGSERRAFVRSWGRVDISSGFRITDVGGRAYEFRTASTRKADAGELTDVGTARRSCAVLLRGGLIELIHWLARHEVTRRLVRARIRSKLYDCGRGSGGSWATHSAGRFCARGFALRGHGALILAKARADLARVASVSVYLSCRCLIQYCSG
jgi:hypothetical protein